MEGGDGNQPLGTAHSHSPAARLRPASNMRVHDVTGAALERRATNVRIRPLPTAGLRTVSVPTAVYESLAHVAGTKALTATSRNPVQPHLLCRLPALPDAGRPPSPRSLLAAAGASDGGAGAVARGTAPHAAASSTSTRLISEEVRGMRERMRLVYAAAQLPGVSAAASAASVGSGIIVTQDHATRFAHLQRLREMREVRAGASEGDDAPGMLSGRRGPGRRVADDGGGVGVGIDADRLRYQSPLEKAHADIVKAWDRHAASTVEGIVRATYNAPLDAPHATLPSFWPPECDRRLPPPPGTLASPRAALPSADSDLHPEAGAGAIWDGGPLMPTEGGHG